MKAVVSEKGQVTIPKALRDRLGIRAGQILDFVEESGRLVAVKAPSRDPLDEAYGLLQGRGTTEAWIAELRGSADLPPA